MTVLLVGALLGGFGAIPSPVSAACPAPGGARVPNAPDPDPKAQVVFRGHGWGHGVGLSQYGAEGAARLGCTARRILTTYYQGTTLAPLRGHDTITVTLVKAGPVATVRLVSGVVSWRSGSREVARQTGGRWTIRRLDGNTVELRNGAGRRVWRGDPPRRELVARLRSAIVSLDSPTDTYGKLPMRLTYDTLAFGIRRSGLFVRKQFADNATGRAMDKYLFGLAEVSSSWPREALRTQAIAARTFAADVDGPLMPNSSHQNYSGFDQEAADAAAGGRWKRAVLDTTRTIVADGAGQPITATFSSSVAGWSEDARFSFGGSLPYLVPVDDSRWEMASSNPSYLRSWTVGFTRAQIAAAFDFDRVISISVPRRGSPRRVEGVRIVGRRNGVEVTEYVRGFTVRTQLGLRSPGFNIVLNDVRPPAGAVATAPSVLPDDSHRAGIPELQPVDE